MVAPTADLIDEIKEIYRWHKIDLERDHDPWSQRLAALDSGLRSSFRRTSHGIDRLLDVGAGTVSSRTSANVASQRVGGPARWSGSWPPIGKRGFDLASPGLSAKVEDVEMEVIDISPEPLGTFDLVLYLGVHLPHASPALALERVTSVVEKHTEPPETGRRHE